MPQSVALAVHVGALLAETPETLVAVPTLAQRLRASAAHLAKVMRQLMKAGLVSSVRGPAGGFRLARPAKDIVLLEVYEAIEGAIRPASCVFEHPICEGKKCVFGRAIADFESAFGRYLRRAKLSDFVRKTKA
jgi:Rrf2 family protein